MTVCLAQPVPLCFFLFESSFVLLASFILCLNFGNRVRRARVPDVRPAENHWVTSRELDEPERR